MHLSQILFCMLQMTCSRTSSIMAEKKSKWPIILRFFAFYVYFTLPFTCGNDSVKSFHVSFPNLLCMLQMTSSRKSLIMTEKIQNGRFIAIFRILRQ